MFRNQYDGDITTWSPKGRIHQVEYALEAVKHGSACVGLKSKKIVGECALPRQKKKKKMKKKKKRTSRRAWSTERAQSDASEGARFDTN